jgi:hypothetical protein
MRAQQDGTVDIVHTSGGSVVNKHRWTLLGQQAGSILVMQDLIAGGTDGWRLNIYAGTGAASPSADSRHLGHNPSRAPAGEPLHPMR